MNQGEEGNKGYPGLPGNYGPRGEDGIPGVDGVDGLPGLPGVKGNRGDPGSAILFGEMGMDGDEGKSNLLPTLNLKIQRTFSKVTLETKVTAVSLVNLV
jgi:hypothetical protein